MLQDSTTTSKVGSRIDKMRLPNLIKESNKDLDPVNNQFHILNTISVGSNNVNG